MIVDPLAQVKTVAAAVESADGVPPLDEDTWLWLQSGGAREPGHAIDDTGFLLRRGEEIHLCTHPAHRGRGVAAARLALVEGPARAWSHGNHPAAARLADRYGFERVRDLWVMRRPMARPLPATTDPRIRAFRDSDRDEVLRVNAAAFADHPEQGALDAAGFEARRTQPWWNPLGLLVAEEEGRIVGFHWTKQHDARVGEVYVVGIDPAAQGRGLGHALTLAGLQHLRRLGVDEVILYVEADNTPAITTYSGLGFAHAARDTHVMYRRSGGFPA